MATCSLLGQAVSNAVSLCVKHGCSTRGVYQNYVKELQQEILYDGVFLPGVKREISDISLAADINITEADREILFSGIDRPRTFDGEKAITINEGEEIVFSFKEKTRVEKVRIALDSDYDRLSLLKNRKVRIFAQKLHVGLDFEPMTVASTLAKKIEVFADGESVYLNENNYNSLLKIPVEKDVKGIRVKFAKTRGVEKVRIFACDLI